MTAAPARRKWLIITQYYPPEVGAPQIRLASMAKQLQRRGIDVEVLTGLPNYPVGKIFPEYAGAAGRDKRRETIGGIPVRRVWIYAASGRSIFKRLANYFSFTWSVLWAALFGPRPDVIFLESQPLSVGIVGLAMKWFRGVPYVYNVPDLQVDVAKQLGFVRSEWFLKLALALENLFLRQSWKVSTVTHQFIEHFVGRGIDRGKVTFLPNGADTEFLQPLPPDPELLERWQLQGKQGFFYVGTQAYYHSLDTLIDAATLLRDRTDLRFVILGDGPEHPRIVKLAEERGLPNVVFGDAPYERMPRTYSVAYASVATVRDMPVAGQMRLAKVAASLACGVPVILTARGEHAELMVKNELGVVVEPEQPQQLADAIAALADDPERRNRLSASGRDFAVRETSWSMIVENWLAEIGEPTPTKV
ncbi:MAG: glycosyltransferase family 4 protein [Pirellulales bacterium]|nr:glycosyltransferase family 4 protein [Pirellulales bacterium]